MVNPKQVQHRGLQVVNVYRVPSHVVGELVGLAPTHARLRASADPELGGLERAETTLKGTRGCSRTNGPSCSS